MFFSKIIFSFKWIALGRRIYLRLYVRPEQSTRLLNLLKWINFVNFLKVENLAINRQQIGRLKSVGWILLIFLLAWNDTMLDKFIILRRNSTKIIFPCWLAYYFFPFTKLYFRIKLPSNIILSIFLSRDINNVVFTSYRNNERMEKALRAY